MRNKGIQRVVVFVMLFIMLASTLFAGAAMWF
ncbi:stressosome-associated protein Prli42 [Mangrovibacillus cuniculi]|uniref:Stressosome-associated protein Prli42 n=1 Tax=Mangrovibacillus cuniculi TaxID=2593652 RepID=A0A7S8HFG0_9BACI|nr:stressosome-associated protein Prli42 [Mangrovibacillus cuniculi]QPC46793.1 stressosome-associated protein Prli42 [Mangrovibacillus cuniculi]